LRLLAKATDVLRGALVAGLLLTLAPADAAWAHRTSSGSTAGLSIPALTHGQMAILAKYRSQILDLAGQQVFDADEVFFRLRNYVDLQRFYCFWGMMPDSISDEASPFNECSHAYLSGLQALLLHMQHMRGDQTRVAALIDRIQLDMLAHNASMVLCQYSGERFNTADHISPRWRDLPFHAPSMLTLLGMAIAPMGVAGTARRLLRKKTGCR
jgi:hypothetical protein